MKPYKYTLEELKDAIENSTSIAQTLLKLEISAYGGNYRTIKRAITEYNLDTSHFSGQGWNKGKVTGPKRSLDYYLSNKGYIQSYKLKNRLIKEGIFSHICNSCNLTEWLNQPISLELHHKNGNSDDNSLENLELLCPNCHAFTDNYRGKAQERYKN